MPRLSEKEKGNAVQGLQEQLHTIRRHPIAVVVREGYKETVGVLVTASRRRSCVGRRENGSKLAPFPLWREDFSVRVCGELPHDRLILAHRVRFEGPIS